MAPSRYRGGDFANCFCRKSASGSHSNIPYVTYRNDENSISRKIMASSRRGDQSFHPCTSVGTTRDQNRSTCTCFTKKRYEKATGIDTSAELPDETINFKPANISKKTCARCYSRRKTITHEQLEPYAESTTQFHETNYNEPDSQDSSIPSPSSARFYSSSQDEKQPVSRVPRKDEDLTPKEIMNTWIPGRVRPAERFFTPSENYIDVSPRGFSIRKYFPEFFLSENEKREIRAEEQEKLQEIRTKQQECTDRTCPQDLNQDWRIMIDESAAIRTPCPWSDQVPALARGKREEVTDQESIVETVQMPPNRPSKWFRWSCRKSKQGEKETDKKNQDTIDDKR